MRPRLCSRTRYSQATNTTVDKIVLKHAIIVICLTGLMKVHSRGERCEMLILKTALIKVSGNQFVQKLLEKNVQVSQVLMGIGSAADVACSGEHGLVHLVQRLLEPPYCIFDVGSNKGQFLDLVLDKIALDNLVIHCFEPGREAFKALRDFSKDDKRIKLNNYGLAKEKGRAILHFNHAGSGLASITQRRLNHFGIDFENSENIKISTIDDYCSENAITHIHLLKIDIEGHELDALAGAKQMFNTKSIDIVTFEFGGCNIDTRTFFQDFWYFFTEKHMKIFRITGSGYIYPIESYKEIYEQFRTTNFVAMLESIHEKVIET
jgi:FkbM family methyltransferase